MSVVQTENIPAIDPDRPDGYERYFGLAESPFKLTSSPRFLFESASYLSALKEIAYALSRREPIIVVTGPIGTGKTTLCRMIGERRGPRTVVAIISSPPQSVDDLFRQVLDSFGLLTDDVRPVVEASHYALLKVFRQFLDSLVALNAQAILVFDEAQHLRPEIIEQIRLLSNLDSDHQTLQLVLIGQPELDDLLGRTDLGQVDQRISRRHRLEPLQPAEISAYINRRLSVAQIESHAGDRPTFTDSAMQAIATVSGGVPRLVNLLCDRSLEKAWSDRTHTVDGETIVDAARALNIEVPPAIAPTVKAVPPVAISTSLTSPLAAASLVTGPVETSLPRTPPARFPSMPQQAARRSTSMTVRLKRSYVPVAVAAAVVVATLLVWMVRGGSTRSRNQGTAPRPAAVDDTRRSAAAANAASASPAAPAAADAPATRIVPRQQAMSTADRFLIVVSSFRTRDRSTRVAADIAALGLPAFVRSASGWEQVVVGPYSSRDDAVAAQRRLETAHFADTKLTPTASPDAAGR